MAAAAMAEDGAPSNPDNSSNIAHLVSASGDHGGDSEDDRSFTFCILSQTSETSQLLANIAQDHFAFASRSATTSGLSAQSVPGRDRFVENSTGRRKIPLSTPRQDHRRQELTVFRCEIDGICPADDLFYRGQLLPLYADCRLQMLKSMFPSPRFRTEHDESARTPFLSLKHAPDSASSYFLAPQNHQARVKHPSSNQQEPLINKNSQKPARYHQLHNTSSQQTTENLMLSYDNPATVRIPRSSSDRNKTFSSLPLSQKTDSSIRNLKTKARSHRHSSVKEYHKDDHAPTGKQSQHASSKASAYWYKSLRLLTKPLDLFHFREDDQTFLDNFMPRSILFNDCKETGNSLAKSVHLIKQQQIHKSHHLISTHAHSQQRPNSGNQFKKKCQSFLKEQPLKATGTKTTGVGKNGTRWQNMSTQNLHNDIEEAIAYCKETQAANK